MFINANIGQPTPSKSEKDKSNSLSGYFRDKKRRIDFVLVCSPEGLSSIEEHIYIRTFISNLESKGLHFELEAGTICHDLIFIKVHGPKSILELYAAAFNIPLARDAVDYQLESSMPWQFMATELTMPDPDSTLFKRAINTLTRQRPQEITSNECITVIEHLLSRTSFGTQPLEYGLSKLLSKGTLTAAYPLHAGPWTWTTEGSLNDRQLLARYWANVKMWNKEQPLEVVEKYFGPEVALYFAFCGFYNRMLLIASGVGIICFIYSFIMAIILDKYHVNELCRSNIKMCPEYFKYTTWKYTQLRDSCFDEKMTYIFDNRSTIFFAFFMCFWATIFMELWKRHYAVLLLRWNLATEDLDEDVLRREYGENTRYRRICSITGTIQPYVPKKIQIYRYGITFVTLFFMIFIILLAVFGTIIYRLTITAAIKMSGQTKLKENVTMFTMTTGSYISVLFITLFNKMYNRLSLWLTIKENPRTQAEFNDSFIYKKFLLSFVNNFAALSYIAFVKGKLYTYPGDSERMMFSAGIQADLCHSSGCVTGLCIQLAFIMLFKSLSSNIATALIPNAHISPQLADFPSLINSSRSPYAAHRDLDTYVIMLCRASKRAFDNWYHHKSELPSTSENLPQWEADYYLNGVEKYFLIGEYSEMVIQYGLVTFFAAAFPLAPLCAFINNMIELRTDANKYVRNYRRPVPVQVHNLNAWNGILQAMTLISTVTNAFVIAFTSDFVKREIYRYKVDLSMKGYINSTLSLFDTKDLSIKEKRIQSSSGICYYRSNRNPPDHPQKYQLSTGYWYELVIRFVVAAIFEHVMLGLTGILAYAIPDIPRSVKTRLKHHHKRMEDQRIQQLTTRRGTNLFGGT